MTDDTFRGRIQIYTGDGKGKTTAAIGLAVRAAGFGQRVAIVQFDKGFDPERGEHYHERNILRAIPLIELYPFGCERMMPDGRFRFKNTDDDREQARLAVAKCRELLESRNYFVVICDEILSSVQTRLFEESEVFGLMDLQAVAAATELVLTGRRASAELIARADLVTEMRPVKHYFDQGLPAREGIEY